MAEQMYTIPVNDAFHAGSECPLCTLYKELEQNAIDYTMGPSYMEYDNRQVTDEMGFCDKHVEMLYHSKNQLGLALMLKTHTDKTLRELKALAEKDSPASSKGFLKRKQETSPVVKYIEKLNTNCFVCGKIKPTMDRYMDTIFHMWNKTEGFQDLFKESRGFCTKHYGLLYDTAAEKLNDKQLVSFLEVLNETYFKNFRRVNEDVSWFIDKKDYRNRDADWKNSQDALPRCLTKVDSIIVE